MNRIVLSSSWGNTFPLNTVAARANSGSRSRLAPFPSGTQQWSFGSRRSVLGSANMHTPVQRNSSLNTAILNKPGLMEVSEKHIYALPFLFHYLYFFFFSISYVFDMLEEACKSFFIVICARTTSLPSLSSFK